MTEFHDYQPATGSAVTLQGAAPKAVHLGQATSIEQTRAVAEVESQVIVAQKRPRDETTALAKVQRSTTIKVLADKAFYDYPKGGQNVRDLTIVAMKEGARCWTNMQFAVVELRQDLANNESEMLAWAWDMEANNIVKRTKIVPHVRDYTDKQTGEKKRKIITDFREIGEILGNWAARQLRECIKDVLPPWYVEAMRDGFNETLAKGLSEKPIEVARAETVQSWEKQGVTREQLETNLGRPVGKWTIHDLVTLRVKWTAIGRGDLRVEEEFPPESLKAADVDATGVDPALAAAIASATVTPPAPEPEPDQPAEPDTGPVPVVKVAEVLASVGITMSTDVMTGWDTGQRLDVIAWAAAEREFLDAQADGDQSDVLVPDRPECLVPADYVCDVCGAVGLHYQDIEPHPPIEIGTGDSEQPES